MKRPVVSWIGAAATLLQSLAGATSGAGTSRRPARLNRWLPDNSSPPLPSDRLVSFSQPASPVLTLVGAGCLAGVLLILLRHTALCNSGLLTKDPPHSDNPLLSSKRTAAVEASMLGLAARKRGEWKQQRAGGPVPFWPEAKGSMRHQCVRWRRVSLVFCEHGLARACRRQPLLSGGPPACVTTRCDPDAAARRRPHERSCSARSDTLSLASRPGGLWHPGTLHSC